jgi:hypothetical protein
MTAPQTAQALNSNIPSAMLGNLTFRINPSQVHFTYNIDTVVIPTIGGRVVQAYGATMGDMVIQGLHGVDRTMPRESWQLAEDFQSSIAQMVVQQSMPPSTEQLSGVDPTPMMQPFRFTFNDSTAARQAAKLPIHDWDLMVYIKSLKDASSDYTISHESGKYSYGYTLTLFIVEDNTGTLKQGVTDAFIQRLSDGVGWKYSTDYNGPQNASDVQAYLGANSPDQTIHGLELAQFSDSSGAFGASAGTGATGAAANPTGTTATGGGGTGVGLPGTATNPTGSTSGTASGLPLVGGP